MSRPNRPPLDVVAFDGDDTLWHSESHFVDAHEHFCALVAPYVEGDPRTIEERVLATERANLAVYGYGAKAFTLSLIESAIELTGGRITSREVSTILGLGKELLTHPVELLDGAGEVVAELADAGHRLILVTKGDLFHQEAKVAGSGLADTFAQIEIVSEKDTAVYRRVMAAAGVPPERFLMVGNSMRSDILPVVELGAQGAHVPYRYTWELERVPAAEAERDGVHELDSIRAVPGLVERLSAGVAHPGERSRLSD